MRLLGGKNRNWKWSNENELNNFQTLRVPSRPYRRRVSQVKTLWRAHYEIYTIYILLHRSNLIISAKNLQHFFANEKWISVFFIFCVEVCIFWKFFINFSIPMSCKSLYDVLHLGVGTGTNNYNTIGLSNTAELSVSIGPCVMPEWKQIGVKKRNKALPSSMIKILISFLLLMRKGIEKSFQLKSGQEWKRFRHPREVRSENLCTISTVGVHWGSIGGCSSSGKCR